MNGSILLRWASVYCTANFSLGGPYIRKEGRAGLTTPTLTPEAYGPPGLEAFHSLAEHRTEYGMLGSAR